MVTVGILQEANAGQFGSDGAGGLTLEPPITPVSELYTERGWKPASEEDFERLTADDLPPDDEG